jgi:hypothetical protein
MARRIELRCLQAHEERMSLPVKELFNIQPGNYAATCVHCGGTFLRDRRVRGTRRRFCSDICRNNYHRPPEVSP